MITFAVLSLMGASFLLGMLHGAQRLSAFIEKAETCLLLEVYDTLETEEAKAEFVRASRKLLADELLKVDRLLKRRQR